MGLSGLRPQVGQSHENAPATTPEEYFSTGPPRVRPLYQPGRHQNATSSRRSGAGRIEPGGLLPHRPDGVGAWTFDGLEAPDRAHPERPVGMRRAELVRQRDRLRTQHGWANVEVEVLNAARHYLVEERPEVVTRLIEGRNDERRSEHVRVDSAQASPLANGSYPSMRGAAVEALPVSAAQDRSLVAFADGKVDGARGAGNERDGGGRTASAAWSWSYCSAVKRNTQSSERSRPRASEGWTCGRRTYWAGFEPIRPSM
jgi:hypothetical protein